MSFEAFYSIFKEKIPQPYPHLLFTRGELIQFIAGQKHFDIIIAGGGIHGAVCARSAALNGLKTLLLESQDYASQTVLRIPDILYDMLHVKSPWKFFARMKRNKLLRALAGVAPHLIRSETHLDEVRFIQENMVAARQEGAACLNYARVDSVSREKEGTVEVGWTDQISGTHFTSSCGIVLNCTGSRTPFLGRVTPRPFIDELETGVDVCVYSSASVTKHTPPVSAVIPVDGGQIIAGHFRGEKELKEEHSARLIAASGIKPEDVRNVTSAVRVSPKHHSAGKWIFANGILNLLPGAAINAFNTALQGIGQVFYLSGVQHEVASLYGRPLPGGWKFNEGSPTLPATRYGALFRLVAEDADAVCPVSKGVLKGEVKIAVQLEQAVTAEDIILRRLGLRTMPEELSPLMAAVEEFIASRAP